MVEAQINISIIICSRTENINSNFYKNIKNSIGTSYELILIDNSENKYSIFEAYNLGIKKSKGKLLVFVHDDVLFHTQNWGLVLENIFKNDSKIGLVGIAVAKIKSKMPSAWWRCNESLINLNIIQHSLNLPVDKISIGFKNSNVEQVVVIDGVFMVTKKENGLYFNEKLKGYHNYDLNFSFECKIKGLKIVVTNEILIEHFSAGSLNEDLIESTFIFHKIYKNYLPTFNYKTDYIKRMEIINAKRFIKDCFKNDKKVISFKVWVKFLLMNPMDKFNIKFLFMFLNIMKKN